MADAAVLEAAEVTALPESDDLVLEPLIGQSSEYLPMGFFATLVATTLTGFLVPYVRDRRLGRVASEGLFDLGEAFPIDRRPDVALVSYERWPKNQPIPETGSAWAVVPDLTVEVVSPSDEAEELVLKVEEYFRAGVRLVWVVYPRLRRVYVYDAPDRVRILGMADEIDGGAVVPGFRLPLTTLFDVQTEASV